MDVLQCLPTKSLQIGLAPRPVNRKVSLKPSNFICFSTTPRKLPSLSISHPEKNKFLLGGTSSSSLFTENPCKYNFNPLQARSNNLRSRNPSPCNSSKNSYAYPKLSAKPKWWWRTLSCVPYLLPLHQVWSYADAIYQLHHLLEGFEFLTNPFLDTLSLLPGWLIITMFMGVYFLVVRRKEWPHFLRFHVASALLLDTGFQAWATVCTWLPGTVYRGLMVYFWMTFAFLQAYTVVECMRCALAGMYTEVPFLSDAAYVHSDLKLLGY